MSFDPISYAKALKLKSTDVRILEDVLELVKEEMVRYGLNIMALKAMAQAETKDFYSVVADYDNYKETVGILGLDNDGGGFWSRNIRIAFDSAATEHAQYKVVIDANNIYVYSADGTLKGQTGVGGFWDGVKSDGSDIRVANQDLTTPTQRYFWIDEFDYANKQAVIWVRVEDGDTELNIVYCNPSATMSSYNNPDQVFEFFDDFEGTELDTTKWTAYGTVSVSVSDSKLSISTEPDQYGAIKTKTTFPSRNVIFEVYRVHNSGEELQTNLTDYDATSNPYSTKEWYRDLTINTNLYLAQRYTDPDTSQKRIYEEEMDYNVWRVYRIAIDSTNIRFLVNNVQKYAETCEFETTDNIYLHIGVWHDGTGLVDWVRVIRSADPISISSIQHIPLETINFDFPDGIDKVLITVDGDISQIEYSTDGGTTWNVIQPDTETLLPTTAYQIKFRFTGGLKGYAFLAW